jgi:DNA-binding MarR family transcriptional regulator
VRSLFFLKFNKLLAFDTYRLINEVFLLGDDIDRQIFSKFALTVRQYHLLNWLAIRGECSLTELADLLLCDKSNVTGIVRRLSAAGYIEKVETTDRRFTKVRLTGSGRSVYEEAYMALNRSIKERFNDVHDPEHQELQRLLAQMYERLQSHIASSEYPRRRASAL